MAVDCFLKIDGIPGESTDAKHTGQINVLSWSWGETQAMAPGAPGGAGKVSMQDFHFSKAVDAASPKLMLACASGQQIKDAVLSCRKAGGSQDFLTITFTEVAVSGYQISDGAAADPTDQLALHFAKIQFDYAQQKPDGTLGAPIEGGWDLQNNKAA
jgi:type VI secretion system secreted protein Hcp